MNKPEVSKAAKLIARLIGLMGSLLFVLIFAGYFIKDVVIGNQKFEIQVFLQLLPAIIINLVAVIVCA